MDFNEKQIQIIETAEKLFADKGFDGTSVRDISEEAHINVAMISYYFGSKEKLMEAVFEYRIGNFKMRVESLLQDKSLAPLQKVNMLIDEYIEKVYEKQCFYKIMLCEQVTNKNPMILQAARKIKISNTEVIAELIKDGQKKGVFKKKIDVVFMINTMIGTIWQTVMNEEYYKEYNQQKDINIEEFRETLKRKLSIHIKTLFKNLLTNEA